MQFQRLDKAKDSNFWAVRVNKGIRVIVHRSNGESGSHPKIEENAHA
jgi:hypothetical protein